MNRKTTAILCAAGGLIAAATILGARRERASALPSDPGGAEAICTDGSDNPSRQSVEFGYGTMNAALSGAKVLRAEDGEVYLAIDLAAREQTVAKRPPLNLAIVIDRSGSMQGDKLTQARSAAKGIVARLTSSDRVALVQYDDSAQIVVSSIAMDDEGKRRMTAAIDGIYDAGGTNLHDGMALGIGEVKREIAEGRVNRVILLSDGQANVGITDTPTLARIAGGAADEGVRVTTIGLGLDYNEDLMEALAENGRGQYYYVRDAGGLEAVFAGELRSMQATVATRAELRLEPSCAGVEILEVYGYASRRDGQTVVVPMADLYGGDRRKLVVRLRMPAGHEGRTDVVRAVLGFDDAIAGGRKVAATTLGIEVTTDAQAVKAALDHEVLVKVEETEAANAMRNAAAAYERGDRAGAARQLQAQKARTAQRAAGYDMKPSATAGVQAELDDMEQGVMAHDPASGAGRDLTKKSKADARAMSK